MSRSLRPYHERYLEHHGVKGMKWGVRKDRPGGPGYGPSRKTKRYAKKDAKEAARAKMFYGEGAGTRRKLSKARVEERSKRLPGYAEEFQRQYDSQDMGNHADKAVRERSRKDRSTRWKQRGSYLARRITGEQGKQAATTALVLGGAAYLRSPKGQAQAQRLYNTAMNSKAGSAARDWLYGQVR